VCLVGVAAADPALSGLAWIHMLVSAHSNSAVLLNEDASMVRGAIHQGIVLERDASQRSAAGADRDQHITAARLDPQVVWVMGSCDGGTHLL
jgi:hypothetical protein